MHGEGLWNSPEKAEPSAAIGLLPLGLVLGRYAPVGESR